MPIKMWKEVICSKCGHSEVMTEDDDHLKGDWAEVDGEELCWDCFKPIPKSQDEDAQEVAVRIKRLSI